MEMKRRMENKNASLTCWMMTKRWKSRDNPAKNRTNNTLMNTRANNKFATTFNDENKIRTK